MPFRRILLVLAVAALLTGCTVAPAIFNPAGPIAADEAHLFTTILWMSLPIFLIVDVGIIVILIRNHQRKGDTTEPRQVHSNTRLEVIWTVIPILLVITIFVLTVVTMRAVAAPQPAAGDVNVTVVGHRWWWEFDYPDLGIVTANELHIPANARVQITLKSVDVIHSFWVPELSGKTDVIPGQENHMWLTSPKPGTYQGQCAEFCGTQHANMRFRVIVDTQGDFNAWASAQQQNPAPPTDALAQQGEKLVVNGVCVGCHTINGTNAKGTVGPNLTHLFSRKTFAGGIAELNDQNLTAWLENPGNLKPGNNMQNVHVAPENIPAILAFLHTLQ